MPTYQYRCTECGHDLEAVQKFSDAALTECPNCGGSLRKVFNAVGVVFKGSGFYRTDSRTSNGNGDGGSGSKDQGERKDSTPATGEEGHQGAGRGEGDERVGCDQAAGCVRARRPQAEPAPT